MMAYIQHDQRDLLRGLWLYVVGRYRGAAAARWSAATSLTLGRRARPHRKKE